MNTSTRFNSQYFMYITSNGLTTGLISIYNRAILLKHKYNNNLPIDTIIERCLIDLKNLSTDDIDSEVKRILNDNKITSQTYSFLLKSILQDISESISNNIKFKKIVNSCIKNITLNNFIHLCYIKLAKQIIQSNSYDIIKELNSNGHEKILENQKNTTVNSSYVTSYQLDKLINKSINVSLYEILNIDNLITIGKGYSNMNSDSYILLAKKIETIEQQNYKLIQLIEELSKRSDNDVQSIEIPIEKNVQINETGGADNENNIDAVASLDNVPQKFHNIEPIPANEQNNIKDEARNEDHESTKNINSHDEVDKFITKKDKQNDIESENKKLDEFLSKL